MPRCPQCNKNLMELGPRCPTCQADLGLLVDYVGTLQTGLSRAESLTRAGELGQAVWAYLEVLEVDPDNPAARRQVGQVATAVRQFDSTVPGRRWHHGWGAYADTGRSTKWLWLLALVLSLALAFGVGVMVGSNFADNSAGADKPKPTQPPPPDRSIGGPNRA